MLIYAITIVTIKHHSNHVYIVTIAIIKYCSKIIVSWKVQALITIVTIKDHMNSIVKHSEFPYGTYKKKKKKNYKKNY